MPKKERVRSQRSKGSWPFKSQEAAGVHRSRMICWSSFLDVLDFSKKKSEALNWGDYQMISRWTGVTFVEEAGLNHLRSATVTKHPISPWVPEIWALSDSLSRRTHDWFVHFGLKRNLSPSFSQHFQANLFSSWDTHRAVKQGCNLLNEMGCWMNGFFKLHQADWFNAIFRFLGAGIPRCRWLVQKGELRWSWKPHRFTSRSTLTLVHGFWRDGAWVKMNIIWIFRNPSFGWFCP